MGERVAGYGHSGSGGSSPRHPSCLRSSPRTWTANARPGSPAHTPNRGFTCDIAGERSHERVRVRARHRCIQNAGHLAHATPLPAYFAEVVCTLDATPPRTVTSPPPNGGNCTIRGATRRRHADRRLLMVQNPHHYPWCHAPSLVSSSLTSEWLPGGAPINAGRATPTETGQGHGRPAPRRRLLPMRRNTRSGRVNPN